MSDPIPTIADIPLHQLRLALFDLDGTLISSYMDTPTKAFTQWAVLPNRRAVLDRLRAEGIATRIITNQGGVAFGLTTTDQVVEKVAAVAGQLGFAVSSLADGHTTIALAVAGGGVGALPAHVAYDHPKASVVAYRGDLRRKPHPTMLHEAITAAGVRATEAVFVGDRPEDVQAAQAAGVRFVWADAFFGVS